MLFSLETAAFAESDEGAYRVIVMDDRGTPVDGVMLQLCSDVSCMMAKTDGDGVAEYNVPKGVYSVHVLKTPEGYEKNTDTYETAETYGDLVITLDSKKSGEEDPLVLDAPSLGFHYEATEKFRNLKGTVTFSGGQFDESMVNITALYYSYSPDQEKAYYEFEDDYINAILEDREPPEAPIARWESGLEYAIVFELYGLDSDRSESDLRAYLRENNGYREDRFRSFEEIAKVGDTTFFLAQYEQVEEMLEDYKEGMGEFYDEFLSIYTDKESFLNAVTLTEPQYIKPVDLGSQVVFETVDLNGNPVKSGEIFAGHQVTMINIWATWCGACKTELPELAELGREFEKKGCQIIGLCLDGAEEGKGELALAVLADAGVEYPNLVVPENYETILPTTGYPASYFVDREGHILVDPIIGAYVDQYPETMTEAQALAG